MITVQDYKHKQICECKYTYTVLKLRVKQIIYSQRYDSIKRPKLQDTQLGILRIYAFCQKIQQRAAGPGESTVGIA